MGHIIFNKITPNIRNRSIPGDEQNFHPATGRFDINPLFTPKKAYLK